MPANSLTPGQLPIVRLGAFGIAVLLLLPAVPLTEKTVGLTMHLFALVNHVHDINTVSLQPFWDTFVAWCGSSGLWGSIFILLRRSEIK